MTQIRIDMISGGTYPITVSIADVYGNNLTNIATIATGTTVPPDTQTYNSGNTTIPSIFNTAPQIMLILTDANGCQIFKILDCTFGCSFQITVNLVSCVVDITIQDASCSFSLDIEDSSCNCSIFAIQV
jgi:hypothetical protein